MIGCRRSYALHGREKKGTLTSTAKMYTSTRVDLVWLYTPLAHKKDALNPKYRPAWIGPMRVQRRKGEVNYELCDLSTGVALQSSPHVSRLKRYHPRGGRPQVMPDLPENDEFSWDKESYLARVNQL